MLSFSAIRARAETRKGGAEILASLLPERSDPAHLVALADDRILAEMTRRIFCAGFVWRVIDAKWDGFEAAFHGFDIGTLLFQPDEYWMDLASDKRIIRNGAKIMAVKHNAGFIADITNEHGGFGRFLAQWPNSDEIGLLSFLSKKGSRLGGNTGQMLLRYLGYDGFVLSKDVVACLRDAGLDIADTPTSKGDLAKAQALFSAWAKETGLSFRQLSRICAMSIGENYTPEHIATMSEGD
jgi:3-methyladenine DNA glycosylase Tag